MSEQRLKIVVWGVCAVLAFMAWKMTVMNSRLDDMQATVRDLSVRMVD